MLGRNQPRKDLRDECSKQSEQLVQIAGDQKGLSLFEDEENVPVPQTYRRKQRGESIRRCLRSGQEHFKEFRFYKNRQSPVRGRRLTGPDCCFGRIIGSSWENLAKLE